MALQDVQVGDVVRVDDEPRPYRVEKKDQKTGLLELESLHSYPRVVWHDVHEFRVQRSGAFS